MTQEVNGAGIYLVKFFVNGVESPVIIDDYLPTKNNKPCYANSRDGELWVMLLEKAWAKLHGSYSRTEGGHCCHAAQQLLGVPSSSFDHGTVKQDVNAFWKDIRLYDKLNYAIFSSSSSGSDTNNVDGVVSGHAYSLISVFEVQIGSSQVRLMKMRNPWGSGVEWKGDWSDHSSLWTPQLKQQLGWTDAVDGLFFISLDDYLSHYSHTSVCYMATENAHSSKFFNME